MVKEYIEELLKELVATRGYEYPEEVVVEESPSNVVPDFSTNLALQLARSAKVNPRTLAESLVAELSQKEGVAVVEVAGPGFLNIGVSDQLLASLLPDLSPNFTSSIDGTPINVEYISANPTGPVHIGNARGGPIGETIARCFEKVGYKVSREFYINDVGGQANVFTASVLHFYCKSYGVEYPFPEKGYPGVYVQEIAEEITKLEGDRFAHLDHEDLLSKFRPIAIATMVQHIAKTVQDLGINFERWYAQSELEQSGLSSQVLELLKQSGATLEKDGALWLRSGLLEDDRETVLVKSDGTFGYFLDDIAYHYDKLINRGFSKAIVLLGANHFGHIPRMRAAMQALSIDPERYEGIMYQYVQLKEQGETKRMAKREGTYVTAEEVLDEIPSEVFKYFILSKANETHLDFDLQLAKDTSEKNPVYYIQYAHARIRSVLRLADERGLTAAPKGSEFTTYERAVLFWLDQYKSTIYEVVSSFKTHALPLYIYELATRYHSLYAHQRIMNDSPEATQKLLYISQAVADTIKDGLHLMGIEATDKM
jgi:arginyl-tRNA synthetase